MEKCCVFFAARNGLLNIMQRTFVDNVFCVNILRATVQSKVWADHT
jgi:hypothetical protein